MRESIKKFNSLKLNSVGLEKIFKELSKTDFWNSFETFWYDPDDFPREDLEGLFKGLNYDIELDSEYDSFPW